MRPSTPVPPGHVRIGVPIFVQDAEHWIVWEIDRTRPDRLNPPREAYDPEKFARRIVNRGYGSPFIAWVDVPVPSAEPQHVNATAVEEVSK